MTMQATSPRQRLLAAVVTYALEHPIAEVSLRQLAAAVGTSHRMLIHHFGNREALLVEVIRVVEERQRALLGEQLAAALETGTSTVAAGLAYWRQLCDPALGDQERLFFEVYGQALRGQPWARPLLDGIVEDWIEPVAEQLVEAGIPPAEARATARLGVAVTRGLLLDVLATGDVAGTDEAMALFLRLTSRP